MSISGRFAQFRDRVARRGASEAVPEGAQLDRPLLVCGLANPDDEYGATRHNIGARCIAVLARRHHVSLSRQGRVSTARIDLDGHAFHVARIRGAYYNESGGPIGQELRRLKGRPQQLLVIYDDLDLPAGQVRMRLLGGSGGNNGMKSVIGALGSQEFARIRIGIDRPYDAGRPVRDPDRVAAWVLSKPSAAEREVLDAAVERVADAVEIAVREGYEPAMRFLAGGPGMPPG
jgi:peptidyl-tRNA hydrolase, PTH1 family